MGKTNYAILGIGLAACVLLSLMMQHVLKASRQVLQPKVVLELQQNYSFERPPEFEYTTADNGGRVAELVIFPQLSSSARRLVRGVGEYVWRNGQRDEDQQFDALVIVVDHGIGDRIRYQVPDPSRVGAAIRLLRDDEPAHFPRGWSPGGATAVAPIAAPSPRTAAEQRPPKTTSRPTSRPAAKGTDDAPGAASRPAVDGAPSAPK